MTNTARSRFADTRFPWWVGVGAVNDERQARARRATAHPGTFFRPLGARLLADCLNEHRAERLSPEHLLMLARMGKDVGCHAILHYQCQEVGYSMPTPIEPRDEAADLQRQYIEATRALLKMSERIERLRSVA